DMTETRKGGEAMADQFLREHPEVWRAWLPPDAAGRVAAALGLAQPANARAGEPDTAAAGTAAGAQAGGFFPDWSAAAFVNRQLMDMVKAYGGVFRQASDLMLRGLLLPVERLMQAIPPWAFLLLVAALSWHATRKPW